MLTSNVVKPWRWLDRHAHVKVAVRLDPKRWTDLANEVFDAAHDLDEELMCTGTGNPEWGIYTLECLAYGLRKRAVQALAERMRAAARSLQPTETSMSVNRRCRCHTE